MRRTGIAVLTAAMALALAVSVCAAPTSTSLTVAPGWNMISLPTAPINWTVPEVFSGLIGAGWDPSGRLSRWNPIARSTVYYEEEGDFGNCLLGDGYWLFNNTGASQTFSYDGADVTGDHWISLPTTGWHLIGYPNYGRDNVPFDELKVTDGKTTKTMADAIASGWVNETAQTWNAAARTMEDVGLAENEPPLTAIEKGRGYWFFSKRDPAAPDVDRAFALIIPGPQQ